MSRRIQIALPDAALARGLRGLLLDAGGADPVCVDRPDYTDPGVLVLDAGAIGISDWAAARPERIVAVARRDADLSSIWERGIRSVVFDTDPLPTIALAVQAAIVSSQCTPG